MSRFPCTLPLFKFFLNSLVPKFLKIFNLFKDMHCRCCGSLLTKSHNKPTYQSPENRATHNFIFFELGGQTFTTWLTFFLCLVTLDPGDNPVKFRPCASNHLRHIKV